MLQFKPNPQRSIKILEKRVEDLEKTVTVLLQKEAVNRSIKKTKTVKK